MGRRYAQDGLTRIPFSLSELEQPLRQVDGVDGTVKLGMLGMLMLGMVCGVAGGVKSASVGLPKSVATISSTFPLPSSLLLVEHHTGVLVDAHRVGAVPIAAPSATPSAPSVSLSIVAQTASRPAIFLLVVW